MGFTGHGKRIPIFKDKLQSISYEIGEFEKLLNGPLEISDKPEVYKMAYLQIRYLIPQTIAHLQYVKVDHHRFEQFKKKIKKLHSLESLLSNELNTLGVQVDEEVNDFYFDIDVKLNDGEKKVILPNYLEIKNEILDFLKPNELGISRRVSDSIKFKIGLKFATGEAQDRYEKTKNFTSTAIGLGFKKSDHNYFSATINNQTKQEQKAKNIYADSNLMNAIYVHCKAENIKMSLDFISKLPTG